jgi:hypothetical protein
MEEFLRDRLGQPILDALSGAVAYVPVVLAATAVFAAGLLVALITSRVVRRVFLALPIEKRASQLGFGALAKGDIKFSAAEVVGRVVWWLVVLVSLDLCADILGFDLLTRVFEYLILYLPRLLLAAFILFAAYIAGAFLGGLARVWASKVEGLNAAAIGKAVKYGLLAVAVVMALEKLYLTTTFFIAVVIIVFGAVMLAAAIAFGLAFADPVKDLTRRWVRKKKKTIRRKIDDTD